MDTFQFLEQLASVVHHHPKIDQLVGQQSAEIRNAFLSNNGNAMKKQLSTVNYFADMVGVSE